MRGPFGEHDNDGGSIGWGGVGIALGQCPGLPDVSSIDSGSRRIRGLDVLLLVSGATKYQRDATVGTLVRPGSHNSADALDLTPRR